MKSLFLIILTPICLAFYAFVPLVAWGQAAANAAIDHVELENENIRLVVSTPSSFDNYRGTRFDHSGIFHKLAFRGIPLCERWHSGPLDTTANDDVTGPCEEFGNAAPLAYKPNDLNSTFLKIGVGILRQPKEDRYRFSFPYEVVQAGTWKVEKSDRSVRFHQFLSLNENVQYDYSKSIELTANGFDIRHRLKNTGQEAWSTDHYNHNFFLINSDRAGPNYEIEYPFELIPTKEQSLFKSLVRLEGRSMFFQRNVESGESYFAELVGHQKRVTDHAFTIRHHPTRLSISCQGDAPLHKLNVWGMMNTICPEPYIAMVLQPDETKEWTLRYVISLRDSK